MIGNGVTILLLHEQRPSADSIYLLHVVMNTSAHVQRSIFNAGPPSHTPDLRSRRILLDVTDSPCPLDAIRQATHLSALCHLVHQGDFLQEPAEFAYTRQNNAK